MLKESTHSDKREKRGSLEACCILLALCLGIVCVSAFVLFEFYGGGVLEHRERILEMNQELPPDVHYALFQVGRITPLSAGQYRFLSMYERISEACGIVGFVLWGIGVLLVLTKRNPEALRNVITIRHPPRPRYQTQFMLFKTLLVFIMRNRVLLLAVIVCLSMFVLSFIMFLLYAQLVLIVV